MPTPISSLTTMSPRGRTALAKAGYKSVEEAKQATDEELLALVGFGEGSLNHLKTFNPLWSDAPGEYHVPPSGADIHVKLPYPLTSYGNVDGKRTRLHAFARELYFQLNDKNGYSPTHAERAWRGALDFEQEREKALAGKAGA